MEPVTLGLLVLVAFCTAILSAIVGMAGGIVLLSTMLLFFEPLVAIPLHGVVQLVSNGSRTWIQRSHVDWSIVWRYALPLLPTGVIGLWILQALSPTVARALIGEPRLLVLDEPTSALDPHSEQFVRQTLDELRERTAVVVVAHRPSLLEIADRVVTFEKGRITATLDQVRRA